MDLVSNTRMSMTLKELVQGCGYRQNFIARRLGMSSSAMSDFVTGKRCIPVELMPDMARMLSSDENGRITIDRLVHAFLASKAERMGLDDA